MFRGINLMHIDPKGRFAIPTKYRHKIMEESNGNMIMTIDTDEACLLLYTQPRWEEVEEKIQSLPSFDPAVRTIQRLLIGHAAEVEMDSQGRLLLPTVLRELLALEKHMVLLGQGHRFEIWSQSRWEEERRSWIEKGVMKQGINLEQLKELCL